MCGILGIIALHEDATINPFLFQKMSDTMVHRGPDGDGFLFAGNFEESSIRQYYGERKKTQLFFDQRQRPLAWAQRRLSIIDLATTAGQPMTDVEEQVWVNFNGEIYNHAEIRAVLEKDGYRFKTDHSDTEVILNAYKKWGIACIHQFRGMFAIALWDKKEDSFFFVRDRIGVKPFYYTIQNDCFYFASEIKAIIEDPKVERKLNEKGAYNYLSFLTVPAPETLFEGIYKLPAGHYLQLKNGVLSSPIQYWDVFDNVNMHTGNELEIQQQLIEQLETSVKYRMVSDVPVGVFLSGGVDSSLNAALFSKISKQPVKAFSIGYKNDQALSSHKNEFQYARIIADKFGMEYHELELTQQDFIDFLPKLVHHQDEPIADPVCMPVYFVSKLAKDNGVTVAQVGEGSDELFWGYEQWDKPYRAQQFMNSPLPHFIKKGAVQLLSQSLDSGNYTLELLKRGIQHQPVFWGGVSAFTHDEKNAILGSSIKNGLKDYTTWDIVAPHYSKYLEAAPEKHLFNWMAYIDLKIRLPELLLMRVDKMGMAVSLEGRVPFLDHKFVEFSMGIPAALKKKNKINKYILKKAVEDILPHDIIYRKKQGFGVPVYDWFFSEFGNMANKELSDFSKNTGILNPHYTDQLIQRKRGDKAWFLLNFAMWHKQYIGS